MSTHLTGFQDQIVAFSTLVPSYLTEFLLQRLGFHILFDAYKDKKWIYWDKTSF